MRQVRESPPRVAAVGASDNGSRADGPGPRRRPRPAVPLWSRTVGPAFVAAVAYVDPGNVATNMMAGSAYGTLLVWVVVSASLFATLVQYLSAKLGLASGATLPELCRERFRRPVTYLLWVQAECVAAATDLAEVLGGAIALYILFGLPLPIGGLIVAILALVILHVQTRGQRRFEVLTGALFACVVIGFSTAAVAGAPGPAEIAGGLVPRFVDRESAVLAAGIVGATVMPHVIYLHSELIRARFGIVSSLARRRRLLRGIRVDVAVAMAVAGVANVGLLIAAAGSLTGREILDIDGAYLGLRDLVSPTVATLFAIGLFVSGLVSSSVGTYAGAVIMDGFLRVRVPLMLRRLVTLLPALIILLVGVDPTRALVISQVVLSFGIPFALIPLVIFTRNRAVMGPLVNRRTTTAVAAVVGGLIVPVLAISTIV
ncbi:MAG TPA: Nramp family divalent metal transporter [Pilimelia sp.]|nr:Nramp family divalent metal transporter [Pilimelia sp.]